jgi:pyrimidine oxygenase
MSKMAATIDDVSRGRLGLNIITGATIGEYAQMGVLPEDYDQKRYAYASEWIHVLKRLWSEPSVTHHGDYFHLEDCVSEPKPHQRPHPFLVCAGASEEGLRFTARETDYAFIGGKDVADIGKAARRTKALGEEERTTIKTATIVTLAIGDTQADAQAYWDHLEAGADVEMLENASRTLSAQARGSAQAHAAVRRAKIHSGHLLVGAAAGVADQLAEFIAETEVDSVVLVFADYLDGLRRFGEGVMPRLRQAFDLGLQGARMPNRL